MPPRLNSGAGSVMRAVRLPRDLATDLETLATRSGTDFSTVARRFLRQRADQALATTTTGPTLLAPPELTARGGTARRDDRPTAKKAAADIAPRAGTQRRAILALFADFTEGGLTTDEVVGLLHMRQHRRWPHNGLARRVTDLLETGAIEPVYRDDGDFDNRPVTRKTRAGAQAQVWRITDKGRAWLNA